MITIKTTRLIIREVSEEDFPYLLAIYTCRENMEFISSGKFDWTMEELKQKYNRMNEDYRKGYGIFVAEKEDDHTIIGEAGLFNTFDDPATLELGYIVDRNYWRKGFGHEISEALIKYAFDQLGIEKVVARMYADNLGSVSLSEKVGMKQTETGTTPAGKVFYRYDLLKEE